MLDLAHTLGGAGGPHTEYLMIGGAALIVSVVLFAQRSVARAAPVVLLLVAIAFIVGAFTFGTTSAGAGTARITIVEPKPGDTLPAKEPVPIAVTVVNQPDGSHVHVFVDGALLDMPTGLSSEVTLPRGTHELTVELTTSNHESLSPPVTDTIEVTAR